MEVADDYKQRIILLTIRLANQTLHYINTWMSNSKHKYHSIIKSHHDITKRRKTLYTERKQFQRLPAAAAAGDSRKCAAFNFAIICSTCLCLLTSSIFAVNVKPRISNNYSPNPYNIGNNNVIKTNIAGNLPVEPDYSAYLHWYYYFSPITLSWLSSNIVPDLISVPPPLPMLVGFDSKAAVYWGNELTPSLVRYPPVFLHWPTQPGALYTIVMADPDVDNGTQAAAHWIVVNIPGTRVDRGDVVVEYLPSAPPRDSGKHRYVFVVYKQTSRIQTSGYPEVTRRQLDGRLRFNLNHFSAHFKLGYPIAGNFYVAAYDDYVPFINKQLGVQ